MGGLLVLFIYICLVCRNFSINLPPESFLLVGGSSLLYISFLNGGCFPLGGLGPRSFRAGSSLVQGRNISILLFLVVLLLGILLVVVRVSGVGSAIISNEKS